MGSILDGWMELVYNVIKIATMQNLNLNRARRLYPFWPFDPIAFKLNVKMVH
jgi:hypothetical protein